MDYIDWVHKVMRSIVMVWREVDYDKKLVGLEIHDIVPGLGFDVDSRSADFQGSKISEAIHDALRDLELVSWLDAEHGMFYKVTELGEAFPEGDVNTAWRQIHDIHLGDEEIDFLRALVSVGLEDYESHTCIREVTWQEVFKSLGWDTEGAAKATYTTKQLEAAGMIRRHARLGNWIEVMPTYVGIVRVAKRPEPEPESASRSDHIRETTTLEAILAFKSYAERQLISDLKRDPTEAPARALLQTYLEQQGRTYREVEAGGGRTDILLVEGTQRDVVETKVWRGTSYHEDGLVELGCYLAAEDLSNGFYVVFEFFETDPLTPDRETREVDGRVIEVAFVHVPLTPPSKVGSTRRKRR